MKLHWPPMLAGDCAWYLTIIPEIHEWTRSFEAQPTTVREQCKTALYDFFEERLSNSEISLGSAPGYFDRDRKAIDTIVLHHTSNPPGLSQERLSAIELIRLYAPYFLSPESEDSSLKGKPVFSGHMRDGLQVFWPYHWIVRRNGKVERMLYDREIGWHAGNWDVNSRSIGIALDNDYERTIPSRTELLAIASLVKAKYGAVNKKRIFGHREITNKTICPSEFFLDGPQDGWKNVLLGLL